VDAPFQPEQKTVGLTQANQNRWVTFSWRLLRFVKRTFWVFIFCVLGYFLVALVGLWPTNANFRPAESGIAIRVISNSVHTDIVFPIITDVVDWRERFPLSQFNGRTDQASHISFGWGNRTFYLDTPNWICFLRQQANTTCSTLAMVGLAGQFELVASKSVGLHRFQKRWNGISSDSLRGVLPPGKHCLSLRIGDVLSSQK
jgi:hypothetical protein